MYMFSKINTPKHGSSAAESEEETVLQFSLADGSWAFVGSWEQPKAFFHKHLRQRSEYNLFSSEKKLLLAIFLNIPQFRGSQNMIILVIRESLMNVSASTLGNLLLLLRTQTVPVLNLNSVT